MDKPNLITRREAESLSEVGAVRLAHRIRQYWYDQGRVVRTRIERSGGNRQSNVFVVRSDMKNGMPQKRTGA